jgi:AraC-like DNA-binding protein
MHILHSVHPSLPLRPYVRAYAQRTTHITGPAVIEHVPARLEQTLEFEFNDPFAVHLSDGRTILSPTITVIGAQTHLRASICLRGDVESFAIFFQPAGFTQLFGIPMSNFTNLHFEATTVLGAQVHALWEQLGESPSFECRVHLVEQFLLGFAARVVKPDIMSVKANQLLAMRGLISVSDLARQTGLSVRQFERKFLAHVGVTPKFYARIARFQSALDAKVASPHRSWLDIAHALSFHDQMHMIYDFQKLAGSTPSRLVAQMGDMRPPALASPAGA